MVVLILGLDDALHRTTTRILRQTLPKIAEVVDIDAVKPRPIEPEHTPTVADNIVRDKKVEFIVLTCPHRLDVDALSMQEMIVPIKQQHQGKAPAGLRSPNLSRWSHHRQR